MSLVGCPPNLLFYCSPGFETECQIELKTLHHGGELKIIAPGLVIGWDLPDVSLSLDQLVFTRQIIEIFEHITDLPAHDRVSPVLNCLRSRLDATEGLYKEVMVETGPSDESKKLASFCKKVQQPLTNGLKRIGYKRIFSTRPAAALHVVFISYSEVLVGMTIPGLTSPRPMGIRRLKFPREAPSRSTLKLEEALHEFLGDDIDRLVSEGQRAVDLGASPGGWTYLLTAHGLYVNAIDRGPMDKELMKTNLVDHLQDDAFKYRPRAPVDWLVCDVLEKPTRVAELMAAWFKDALCQRAIFNLKLPMKKRYEEVSKCLNILRAENPELCIAAKHLYHDREEITVYAYHEKPIRRSQRKQPRRPKSS